LNVDARAPAGDAAGSPARDPSAAELQSLALRSELVLRTVAEGIVGVDRAGVITFANQWAARAIGKQIADLVGRDAHRVAPHLRHDGSLCDGVDCALFGVFRTGTGTFAVEARFVGPDGQPFPVEFSCVPAAGEDGVEWAVFSFRNITERKRMQGELIEALVAAEKANRAKSQFLSNMSHELRTPLNAIIGYSEMLIDESRGAGLAQFESDLEKIHRSGRNLLALIDTVLEIARIEAGRMELSIEDFEIAALVYEVETQFAQLLGGRREQFRVAGASDAGRVRGDADKVRKILLNLLSNANKFGRNGEVVLEVRRIADARRGDRVEFRVTDAGIGIPPELIDRIFEPFVQGDASTTRRFSGTGLGLALSSRLAHLMHGDITVASTPGEGSTFTVSIPAQIRAAASGGAAR
jgi:PAS domain S-box-containing protein